MNLDQQFKVMIKETTRYEEVYTLRELMEIEPAFASLAKSNPALSAEGIGTYLEMHGSPPLEEHLNVNFGEVTGTTWFVAKVKQR